ncbi:MAG: hypothetical protein WBF53_15115 [Litorimonas sp.]
MTMMQILPPTIMFAITVAIVSLCFVPATYERPSKVLNFYWVGVWMFIGLIAAISGGEQTIRLAGYDPTELATRLQIAATLCFMIFVVFGWVRLSSLLLISGVRRVSGAAAKRAVLR